MGLRIAVIGGGAAGFFGAIAAAEAYPQTRIDLFEAGYTFLAKVRISGGGRCNVTHHCFDPAVLINHYPRGGKALRGAFTRFQPQDTVAWFNQRGVALKTEADGRMFPVTDDSETIVECLLNRAQKQGVVLRSHAPIIAIQRQDPGFQLQLKSGQIWDCDRILLATGGSPQGYKLVQSLGHPIEAPVPSLFTFNIADPDLRDLAGIAVESAHLKLTIPEQKPFSQTGPLLVTHWGFSGPAVLKLSAWGARTLHSSRYHGTLQVNWLPEITQDNLRQTLSETRQSASKRLVSSHCPFNLPRRLWHYLLHRAGVSGDTLWSSFSKQALTAVVQELGQGQYAIAGKGSFKDEFVTCGGVRLKDVDFKTMESRICPGLYLAGEVLDVDGVTGGFNFQSAWTTGWLAGQAIGQ